MGGLLIFCASHHIATLHSAPQLNTTTIFHRIASQRDTPRRNPTQHIVHFPTRHRASRHIATLHNPPPRNTPHEQLNNLSMPHVWRGLRWNHLQRPLERLRLRGLRRLHLLRWRPVETLRKTRRHCRHDERRTNQRTMKPKHGWRSQCDPKDGGCTYKTFSMSFFRSVPTKDGKRFKAQPIGLRLKGPTSHRDAVAAMADRFVTALDNGWSPDKKSFTYRP